MRIFLHLSAFVRFVARAAGGDRLTNRHKVKEVKKTKKTRIQEVPEFRGPDAASRFGRVLAGRVLAVFRPFFGQIIVTRCSGG